MIYITDIFYIPIFSLCQYPLKNIFSHAAAAVGQTTDTNVETAVLLSGEKVDGYIGIEKLEGKSGTAADAEIEAYIRGKYGFNAASLYIGQIKDKAETLSEMDDYAFLQLLVSDLSHDSRQHERNQPGHF